MIDDNMAYEELKKDPKMATERKLPVLLKELKGQAKITKNFYENVNRRNGRPNQHCFTEGLRYTRKESIKASIRYARNSNIPPSKTAGSYSAAAAPSTWE